MVINSTIVNKTKNHLSFKFTEHNNNKTPEDHDIWRWKCVGIHIIHTSTSNWTFRCLRLRHIDVQLYIQLRYIHVGKFILFTAKNTCWIENQYIFYIAKIFTTRWQTYLMKYIEWVIDCCLTLSQQFFSYIMARTIHLQWDDEEVHFVLDKNAQLDFFYSTNALKQQSAADRHIALLGDIFLIPSQSLPFLLSAAF